MDSILTSIKKSLGMTEEYDAFDADIIMHINSVFSDLAILGVGPSEGFAITDSKATWSDFIGDNKLLNHVKSYMYLRLRLLFDPPTNSTVHKSYEDMIGKYEWLLNVTAESKQSKGEEENQNG